MAFEQFIAEVCVVKDLVGKKILRYKRINVRLAYESESHINKGNTLIDDFKIHDSNTCLFWRMRVLPLNRIMRVIKRNKRRTFDAWAKSLHTLSTPSIRAAKPKSFDFGESLQFLTMTESVLLMIDSRQFDCDRWERTVPLCIRYTVPTIAANQIGDIREIILSFCIRFTLRISTFNATLRNFHIS